MPTYTYECSNCGERFDARQSFSDDPLEVCQVCEAKGTVHRVIQAAGVIFKGSGFYVTDSKGSKSSTAPPTNGTSDKKDSSSESSTTTDSSSSTAADSPAAE